MAFSGVLSKFSQKANSLFQGAPEFTVICDRVHTMCSPTSDGGRNDVHAVADALKTTYGEHFMVWNLSEKPYDYDLFDNQVLEFKFPGYPCPPLSILIELIKSIRSWLSADPTNVAIVHCATGHVRTATVVACHLAFCGTFSTVNEALAHYYDVMKLDASAVTIPSQLRYIQYFGETLSGFDPKDRPLMLQCIVANDMPMLTKSQPAIQLFENSKLVFSSGKSSAEIVGPGTVSFPVNHSISGDVLIRSRQPVGPVKQGSKPTMTSVFRINIHTAFVTSELVRLTKDELDGPHREHGQEWPDSMFVDLIFGQMGENIKSPIAMDACAEPPTLWEIARNEQGCNEEELSASSQEVYEPYEPYQSRSRKGSVTEEMIEDEIACAELSDAEEDALAGLSNQELMEAVGDLPDPSPGNQRNPMSLSNLSTGVAAISSPAVPANPPVKESAAAPEDTEDEELEAQISAALADGEELDLVGQDQDDDDWLAQEVAMMPEGDRCNIEDDDAWMAELEAELGSC